MLNQGKGMAEETEEAAGTADADASSPLAEVFFSLRQEYLEGIETGTIRSLSGFQRGVHKIPDQLTDKNSAWVNRLMTDEVQSELEDVYKRSKKATRWRRRDLAVGTEMGDGDLDTPKFRYSVQTRQSADNPARYEIIRRLELKKGWRDRREAIDLIFGEDYERLVFETNATDLDYDDLVDRLEDIEEKHGGHVDEEPGKQRVSWIAPDRARLTFDLKAGRLEMSFGQRGGLNLVDAAQSLRPNLGGQASTLFKDG
jgi:hypothetical protein